MSDNNTLTPLQRNTQKMNRLYERTRYLKGNISLATNDPRCTRAEVEGYIEGLINCNAEYLQIVRERLDLTKPTELVSSGPQTSREIAARFKFWPVGTAFHVQHHNTANALRRHGFEVKKLPYGEWGGVGYVVFVTHQKEA